MAISKLSTNYIDDIINTSVNEHKKYKLSSVSGEANTFTFEDTTVYIQKGNDFKAEDANATNSKVNEVIDAVNKNSDDIAGMISGTVTVGKATEAEVADNATVATSATNAEHSDSATTATSAGNAKTSDTSALAEKLKTPRTINGVPFDGSKDIVIKDNTKVSKDEDFILCNQQTLTFDSNRVCKITDARITASSLADVYFTSATEQFAKDASIVVETYAGYVTLTAKNTPASPLICTIQVRVV